MPCARLSRPRMGDLRMNEGPTATVAVRDESHKCQESPHLAQPGDAYAGGPLMVTSRCLPPGESGWSRPRQPRERWGARDAPRVPARRVGSAAATIGWLRLSRAKSGTRERASRRSRQRNGRMPRRHPPFGALGEA